jgi:hypothetical protein
MNKFLVVFLLSTSCLCKISDLKSLTQTPPVDDKGCTSKPPQYWDSATNNCVPCSADSGCVWCNGITTCRAPNSPGVGTNQCVDKYFATSNTCTKCDANCGTCETSATQCTSCDIKDTKVYFDKTQKKCVACSNRVANCNSCNYL